MKRLLSLFFMACLLVVPQRLWAYSNGDKITKDGFIYYVLSATENTLYVYGTTNTGAVEIPSTVFDGKDVTFTVTQIKGDRNSSWSGVTSVTLPNTITRIDVCAFYRSSITELNIPASVTTISSNTFYYFPSTLERYIVDSGNTKFEAEDGVLYTKGIKALVSVPVGKTIENGVFTVPNGVTSIYNNAFAFNTTLEKVIIPASVTDIKVSNTYNIAPYCQKLTAFEVDEANTKYCSVDGVIFDKEMSNLVVYPPGKTDESYKVPDGVKEIVSYGFVTASKLTTIDLNEVEKLNYRSLYSCSGLTTVTIPAGLETIPDAAFDLCRRVQNYKVKDGNPNFADIDGVLFSADKKTLLAYPIGRSGNYEIPQGTTAIADAAFHGATVITSIVMPNSITTIGDQSFRDLISLTNIVFAEPAQVKNIGASAFQGCTSLETITLPTSLTETSKSMFYNCTGLKEVIVPDGSQLTTINNSFDGCSALESFTFAGSCSLTTIAPNAFADRANLKSFYFPASVATIGARAFSGCTSMSTVTFAEDAVQTTIGNNAFAESGITSITLPESVTTIESEAFKSCNVLETVNLSKNVSTFSSEAFKFCSKLKEINVDRANTTYSSIDGILLSKDKETLALFPPGKANDSFTLLPPSITKIGDYAFYYNDQLKNVTIPNKVTTIGKRAFGLCPNLNTVTFLCDEMIDPSSIAQALNEAAFDDGVTATANQFASININVRKEKLADYQASEFYQKFKSINPSFENGNEEYIAVSDNAVDLLVTQNEDYTYILPKTVTNGSKTYDVAMIGDYAFQNYKTNGKAVPKEVVIFDNVQYIGAKAFMTDIDANTSEIESIFFIEGEPTSGMLSTTRFELDDTANDYSEIASTTKVYVKKSALDKYKNAFSRYVEDAYDYNHTTKVREATPDMFAYKVPFSTKGSVYGTLSREFAIDLSDQDDNGGELLWNNALDCPNVIAFTAGRKAKGKGDTPEAQESEYHVSMTSINLGGEGDGTYIPANTGVLIKVMDSGKLPDGAYYRIAESQTDGYNGENLLGKVVLNSMTIDPNAAGYDKENPYYVMGADNLLHAVKKNPYTLDAHEAYLQLPADAAAKRLVVSFVVNDETTGIVAVGGENRADGDALYDLQGRRVQTPQRGIYIKNGKKVIIK